MEIRINPKYRGDGMSLFDLPPEAIQDMVDITREAYPNFDDFEAEIKRNLQEAEEALAELEERERAAGVQPQFDSSDEMTETQIPLFDLPLDDIKTIMQSIMDSDTIEEATAAIDQKLKQTSNAYRNGEYRIAFEELPDK